MKIEVKRRFKGAKYTIGSMFIDGKYFCDTLEDVDRGLSDNMTIDLINKKKIYSQTAIPIGAYNVMITYSPKYNKNMPLICNVKGFSGIRIHSGNTEKDTKGCILVGENKVKGLVINSRNTYNKLFEILKLNHSITITIS